MALVTFEEAMTYLRVDSSDEDALIGILLSSAEEISFDVARLNPAVEALVKAEPEEDDTAEIVHDRELLRTAILYALGYLYEHREEADHHDLLMTLRSILFSIREGVF